MTRVRGQVHGQSSQANRRCSHPIWEAGCRRSAIHDRAGTRTLRGMSVRRHVTRHFHARSHILREYLAMKDAAVLLSTALDVVLQFGPDRRRPENERLRERLPAVNEADRAAVLATAHEV